MVLSIGSTSPLLPQEGKEENKMGKGMHLWRLMTFMLTLSLLAWAGPSTLQRALAKVPMGEGKPAPEFTLVSLDGETIRLSDYRGKVLLLDFWHTY